MKVVCFAGGSGAGKTTLIEGLIGDLKARGLRVSVVKHAQRHFDIDHPGKDSFRHREAGAFEVVVASSRRMALLREFEQEVRMTVHQALANLYEGVDWVLVEGYRDSDLLKVEVWRPELAESPRYMHDECIVAVATSTPDRLPETTLRPVFPLDQPAALGDWLVAHGDRFDYDPERYQ